MRLESTLSDEPEPKPAEKRPGGRSARVLADVVAATLAEVTEKPYDQLTAEAVAVRAGVHKATLYRRWGGVDGLVAQALESSAEREWPVPDAGSVERDLRLLAGEVQRVFADPEAGATPRALIAAALRSERGAAALHAFFAARHRQAAALVSRAVVRGELPDGTDPVAVVRAATAPLYHCLFLTGEPLDGRDADRAAEAALVAARAGVFVNQG